MKKIKMSLGLIQVMKGFFVSCSDNFGRVVVVVEEAFLVGIEAFVEVLDCVLEVIDVQFGIEFFHFVEDGSDDFEDFCRDLVNANFLA